MKKLSLILMSFLFVLAVNVGHADAVPDIRGEYSGSYTTVVSNCTDSSCNGTYYATLAMSISTQTGNTFSGSATGTFEVDGLTAIEYIQLSGTITESGQISGNTSHTFLGTGGEGTFTGQLSGNTLSIENPGHDTYGETCTYIRSMSATRLPSEFKLFPDVNIQLGYHFGHSVSISGDYAIVGNPTEDWVGAAYIFERSGNSWNKVAKLTKIDGVSSDFFGSSVSIYGDYVIVGNDTDYEKGHYSGAAYIFERSGNSWNKVAQLTASDGAPEDGFGSSVSIYGDYAIVGAAGNDDNGTKSGSAYIFERSGSSWNQVAKLTASDAAFSDHFGFSVSISGGYVIVGAFRDKDNGTDSGSAYIFERSGSSWNQVTKLTASDGAAYNFFGHSVSISGGYAIVGVETIYDYGTKLGSAYIFERSGSSWNQVAKLTASDAAFWDHFGSSVSISGDCVIVGAWNRGDESAYIFKRSGSSWNQVTKLTASDGVTTDNNFGFSVSISGDCAILGAPGSTENYIGFAYIYDLSIPDDEVILHKPNGGEIIRAGSLYTIEWDAPFIADNFKLRLSTDNGKPWETIDEGITDNSYDWEVPTFTKNQTTCLIKVVGYDTSGAKVCADKSDSPFTIAVLTVTSPNGGEVVPSGDTYDIEWETNGTESEVESVELFYSRDGGTTWKLIETLQGNPGTYEWTVPGQKKNLKNCLVKVKAFDVSGNKVAIDKSDAPFTIAVLEVTSPNGGETLTSGDTHTITWTTNETKAEVAKVKMFYTQNGGDRWIKIDTLTGGDTGTYDWEVPSVNKVKTECRVKVELKDAEGNTVGKATSDSYFTIEPLI